MRRMTISNRVEAGGKMLEAISLGQDAVRLKPYSLNPTPYSLQPIAAASRFGRYKPEPSHEVRPSISKAKTLIEELRQKRHMLRCLDPEKAKTVIEFTGRINFFEAVALAKREVRLLVPNIVHDKILTETEDKDQLRSLYSNVTSSGTLVIYESPNTPFKDEVTFEWEDYYKKHYSISFIVPELFRGKVNCVLVVEHPDFDIIDFGNGNYKLKADDSNVFLLQDFPKTSGDWSMFDEMFRVPVGTSFHINQLYVMANRDSMRQLHRSECPFIGPLSRAVAVDKSGRLLVTSNCSVYLLDYAVALF